jgi:hypothetical protein
LSAQEPEKPPVLNLKKQTQKEETKDKDLPLLESPDDAVWGAALWLYDQLNFQGPGPRVGGYFNINGVTDIRFLSLYNVPIEGTRFDLETKEEVKYSPLDESTKTLLWVVNQTNRVNPPVTLIKITDTLYAVPLSQPGWDSAAWDAMASQDPYFGDPEGFIKKGQLEKRRRWVQQTNLDYLIQATGTFYPIMRADKYIQLSTIAPDYYNLLFGFEKVKTLQEFYQIMGVQEQLLKDSYRIKAGVRASQLTVTRHNRRLERREGVFDVWTSLDVANEKADRNAMKQLGFLDGDIHQLKIDGQEHIFELGWGGFGGYLNDANGNRVDEVPVSIAPGEVNFIDRRVRAGRSCITCHDKAIKDFTSDQHNLLKKQVIELATVDPKSSLILRAAYDESKVQEYIELDQLLYEKALARLVGKEAAASISQIYARTWKSYDEDRVDIKTASREMGLTVNQATAVLVPSIDPGLLTLISLDDNQNPLTISREVWEDAYDDAMFLKGEPKPPERKALPQNAGSELPKVSQNQKELNNPPEEKEAKIPQEGVFSSSEIVLNTNTPGAQSQHLITIEGTSPFTITTYKADLNEAVSVGPPQIVQQNPYKLQFPITVTNPNNGTLPTLLEMRVSPSNSWIKIPIKNGNR